MSNFDTIMLAVLSLDANVLAAPFYRSCFYLRRLDLCAGELLLELINVLVNELISYGLVDVVSLVGEKKFSEVPWISFQYTVMSWLSIFHLSTCFRHIIIVW